MRILILLSFVVVAFTATVLAQPTRPSMTSIRRTGVWPLRTKPTREQKKLLQPNPQELSQYQQLLSQPRTGMMRLLPDIGCYDNMNVLKADEVCRNAVPESSFFSFREREHTLEALSDIRLKSGHLISDGILSQGIITSLGNISIERVSLDTAGIGYLRSFEPEPVAPDAKTQYIQFVNGIKSGDHEYRKAVRVVENSTYAIRVVAYRGNVFRSFRGWKFDLLEGDKRIDITIAFRVVRKDPEGAVTIVWKELERRESPRLKFPKKK